MTMARKRLISPEFFLHGELYDAEQASGQPIRLFFAGLWTQADRRGCFVWKPRELKAAILPYDAADPNVCLTVLERLGNIRRWTAEDGRTFGQIVGFHRWQTFHPTEKPSPQIPEPPEPSKSLPDNGNDGPNGDIHVTAPVDNGVKTSVTVAVAVAGTVKDSAAQRARGATLADVDNSEAVAPTPQVDTRGVADRLTPEGRAALDGILRRHPMPAALLAELGMILDGARPQVPSDPASVSLALADLRTDGGPVTGKRLRIFVQGAKREAERGEAPTRPGGDDTASVLARALAGGAA